ncbi:protein lifeguard 3-like [Discoglossus pictus]
MANNMEYGDRGNMPNPPMTYHYAQNPAYTPEVPYNRKPFDSYMPPPPDYTSAPAPGPNYSSYPQNQQPQINYPLPDYNFKPDVENVPPEYTTGFEDSSPFAERDIRRAFIWKVYITLAIQLVVTVGLICMFIFWNTLREWVHDVPYFGFALCGVSLIMVIGFSCCDKIRRKVPANFIFLGLFTLVEGCLLGSLAAQYSADAVLWATGATVFVTMGLTLFAVQTKWDFTLLSGALCMTFLVFLSYGFLAAILRTAWLDILYACIGTFIFGMYLVVDTQRIVGGKNRHSTSPEEYIYAALSIYLDIVNLFIFLLQLFGLCN